ncbi:MAG: recombinase family protein, partial [Chloroflexota bacterium]|nr:recombinase family protein [Chloroflexota bacterium]
TKTALIVDPATAPTARRLFAAYAGGLSLNKLSKQLEAQGVAAPRGGGRWSLATLQGIFRNRAYIGEVTARLDGEEFTLPCPALIDRDTFDAAQRLLDNNQRHSARNSAEPDAYLLRGGFVVCGHCGQVATAQATPSRGHRYRYYRVGSGTNHRACGHRFDISAPALDDAIWRRVVYLLTNADAWNDQIDRLLQDDGDPTPGDLADVERRIGEVERKRKNLLDALEDEDDPRERAAIKARRAELAGSLDALEREREAVLARRERWARAQKAAFDIDRWRERRAADLHEMTVEQRKAC